jgi:hypothetical protein
MRKPEGYQTPLVCQRPKVQFAPNPTPHIFRDSAGRRFDLALNKRDKFWYSPGLNSHRMSIAKEKLS